ncbi:hypothetical protein Ping_3703 [Psychromonas ingrahamii 37]|uniref:Uncharacterized protein n=1 Tax=Psychromonas ingrahamii (strain DSM 17664 / CCUG 51855 / 37) TaxID=357804 RepID=A1T0W4_PSYIN|nr:hypothetical protein Ping_3703 [Psychromonas ingrahamii 37]
MKNSFAEQNHQKYQNYNPFYLKLISSSECLHLSWNGRYLSVHNVSQAALLLSSSALNTETVLAKRQRHFQQWLAQLSELSAAAVLQKIHLQHNLGSRAGSVLMDRSDAYTKSTCQVLLGVNYCKFNYYPEDSLQQWRCYISNGKNPQLIKQQRVITLQNSMLINEG